MLIDTHCHLDKPRFKSKMNTILQEAQKANVRGLLIPSTQRTTIDDAQVLAHSYNGVFFSVGFHPKYADKFEPSMLEEYVNDERCIAIGEFGLEYGRMSYDEAIYKPIIEQQKKVLKAHLEFAVKHQKPVIIHLNDGKSSYEHRASAYEDFMEILQPYLGQLVGGIIHALNFDRDEYRELHKHGFYFGIGGQITFKNLQGLKDFVKKAPIESLLLETDAPWLIPRGRKEPEKKISNVPAYIVDVLETLAEVLEMKQDELEAQIEKNTLRLFPQFKEAFNGKGYSMGKVRNVHQLGSKVLREVAQKVDNVTSKETQELIDDLILTCRATQGMGIASPQIGVSKRIFIMASHPNERYPDAPKMQPKAIVNPEILSYGDELEKAWEGCLSLPNVRGEVPRSTSIEVRYTTQKGEVVEELLEGFLARIFQHEFDHLEGKVFIDRVESTRDIVMEREYRKMVYGRE